MKNLIVVLILLTSLLGSAQQYFDQKPDFLGIEVLVITTGDTSDNYYSEIAWPIGDSSFIHTHYNNVVCMTRSESGESVNRFLIIEGYGSEFYFAHTHTWSTCTVLPDCREGIITDPEEVYGTIELDYRDMEIRVTYFWKRGTEVKVFPILKIFI